MYHQVEGYWKVQLVCVAILVILIAVITLCNRVDNNIYEANETSCVIVYMDRFGIEL